MAIIKNITERKQMEVERREMESKAQLTSRLATVGKMASGIAHEINNPLTGVIGYAQLVMRGNIPEDIKADLEIINDNPFKESFEERVNKIMPILDQFSDAQRKEIIDNAFDYLIGNK